jgi:hypothetical protein
MKYIFVYSPPLSGNHSSDHMEIPHDKAVLDLAVACAYKSKVIVLEVGAVPRGCSTSSLRYVGSVEPRTCQSCKGTGTVIS